MEADISVETAEPTRSRRRRGRGRGKKIVITTVVVLAAAAAGVAAIGVDKVMGALGVSGFGGKAAASDTAPPATTEVARQTLRQTQDADGELGYGPTSTAASRKPGTVTWLPDSGDTIKRGDPLFAVDTMPTTLMYGTAPAYRDMKVGDEGSDVKQLEKNLAKLGYDGFTVDKEFTADTATAVREWQDDLGLKETGTVTLGQVVFADGAIRIDSFEAEVGLATGPDKSVLSYTGTDKVVAIELEADDQQLAKEGDKATVSLPNGETADGEITDVSSLIKPPSGQQEESETVIQVLVSLDDDSVAKGLSQAAVTATFTASEREDVLTVPVAALVALEGGGFGVEVVDGDKTEQVEVETGLFAAGRVEISGSGIDEGTVVGVPE
ncbi:peptidoglycan-binding protein [Stackebrandtia nassauensis]|uniref:Peptidoglycan-binding domain 1 protein n=1 Tax=Stackebrandtia nassauensis (strain DSM 44728 / CIP 108903 / NRRL B-16338 / NBRC 102104 / LLR-40K-21) TaxID=446470 RepID=D3Q039_STANL|nr:peptidoglycan-binding protein [Stackebrandtia nassauensis]ADD45568.1 Peptidoglycan-binding domain 1 protein [Stackebrandtia nassauensis DSM 44728]